MKRGWITWDRTELPPSVFQARMGALQKVLVERKLPAAVVYTDVWRSNQARHFANFMPYWNRALLAIPQQEPPILICGLSPRVYPWIRSVSVLEDIRPSPSVARGLLQLCSDYHWNKIAVLDLLQLPQDIHASLCAAPLEVADLPSGTIFESGPDESELFMRRRAANLARQVVSETLASGVGTPDYQFVSRLELAFRRAGAEDLVILLSNGKSVPRPADGTTLQEGYSLSIAVEYRGHWAKLSRPQTSAEFAESLRKRFDRLLTDLKAPLDSPAYAEDVAGPYPYEPCDRFQIAPGSMFALHVESNSGGHRLFYGDTCWYGENGAQPL